MMSLNRKNLLVFFIFVPIFVSFSTSGQIGFDRVGGIASQYFFSVPISFLIIVTLLFKFSETIFQDKLLVTFILYSIGVLLLGSIYNGSINVGLLKTIIWMNVFVSLLTVFSQYFDLNYKSLEQSLKIERLIVFIYFSILAITLLSFFALGEYTFLLANIKIYNFQQYFAFIFIPLIAILRRYSFVLFLLGSILTIVITVLSVNTTALFLALITMTVVFVSYFFEFIKTKLTYQLTIFVSILFAVVWIFTLPYWAYGVGMRSLSIRADNITYYFENIEWYSIIFPFLHKSRVMFYDMHNEFLEVFNAVGIFGLFIYYHLLLRVLRNFSQRYRLVGIAFVFSIFISGVTVGTTLHAYTLIIFSFGIAFYHHLSRQPYLSIPHKNRS